MRAFALLLYLGHMSTLALVATEDLISPRHGSDFIAAFGIHTDHSQVTRCKRGHRRCHTLNRAQDAPGDDYAGNHDDQQNSQHGQSGRQQYPLLQPRGIFDCHTLDLFGLVTKFGNHRCQLNPLPTGHTLRTGHGLDRLAVFLRRIAVGHELDLQALLPVCRQRRIQQCFVQSLRSRVEAVLEERGEVGAAALAVARRVRGDDAASEHARGDKGNHKHVSRSHSIAKTAAGTLLRADDAILSDLAIRFSY